MLANDDTRRLFIDRAKIVSALRSYLDDSRFIEVETPVLQPLYGGASARPFTTHYNELGEDLYLRIATELYLKRLIVGGLERVYELAKDFRNEGFSPKHSPEFTMLEFYEAYADYNDAALRLEQLVLRAAEAIHYAGPIDLSSRWRRIGFVDAVKETTGIDLGAHRDAQALAHAITERGLRLSTEDASWSHMADDLLSKFVEPTFIEPTFVLDYPLELSPFARPHPSKPGLAERWEAFVGGVELANAFSEINDPHLQRERLDTQRHLARLAHEDAQPHDELFLGALNHGMPPTAGVGIGVDRLVMILTGRDSIREVIAFPAMRHSS